MKTDDKNDVILWQRYPATLSFIKASAEDAFPKNPGKQKEFKKFLLDSITDDLVRKSGAEYRHDGSRQPDYIKIKGELLSAAKLLKKDFETGGGSRHSEVAYYAQLEAVKRMNFVDAIMPLLDFTKWAAFLRAEFEINPKKLKRQLGLSDEEIAAATYVAKPAHHELVVNYLHGDAEMRRRRSLAMKKLQFEHDFFNNYYTKKKNNRPRYGTMGTRPLSIPKIQEPHIRNFILYGVKTGMLVSTIAMGDGKGRSWHNRILGDNDSRGRYVPFLRYWLYYVARKIQKKSPTEAGNELIKLGFPSVKRESDDTLIKRYEGYFLE